MSTQELNLFSVLKKELDLSDEKAFKVIDALERAQAESIRKAQIEFKSEMKEDFYKLDLRYHELIKWIVALFIGSYIATIGTMLAIMKL